MEDLLDLNMETGDSISLPASSNPEVKEVELNGENLQNNEVDVENDGGQPFLATNKCNDQVLVDSTTILQVSVGLNELITAAEDSTTVCSENRSLAVQNGSPLSDHKRDGSPLSNRKRDGSPLSNRKGDGSPISSHEIDADSGVKRPRITVDEQQASVHVIYNSLTRDSKQKLEELLQKWSEWHARHYSSSHDSKGELESGEGTYFPALHVGLDKSSAVSFWMDNQTRNLQSKEFIPLDNNYVPLYDRGYSFGLTSTDGSSNLDGDLGIVDASRCFNCGSYNHALKECPKPRDNVAVNSARKQHKPRRNQNASSRNPTRYYQNTPGGKYDGLRPGVLDAETRQLLGLGELDPPPWLNRMREIGYPPGYLDPEDEDRPSGIRIFGDEDIKQETEDGEILDTNFLEPPAPEPPRKMSVEFPGLNAPVPENADERRWAAGPSSFDLSRNRSHRRSNHSTEPTRKPHYHEQQRWTRDLREDGPPGVEPGSSPLISAFSPRYSDYDSSYTSHSPRGNNFTPRSPSYGRSLSERGIRSPLVHETPLNRNYHGLENRDNDRWNEFTPNSSYHHKDRHEEYLRHSRR